MRSRFGLGRLRSAWCVIGLGGWDASGGSKLPTRVVRFGFGVDRAAAIEVDPISEVVLAEELLNVLGSATMES